jgi:DnaK suppressor protein
MDSEQAKKLVAAERERVEKAIAALERGGPEEGDQNRAAGDYNSENLYQDEFDAGQAEELKDQLSAVERAEARIAEGTYGVSIRSGEQIPDGRLEAHPTAELTVDEAAPGGHAA